MDFLVSFLWGLGLWVVVQLVRFALADCDLTLQWVAKFGRKPSTLIGKVVWITGASSGIGEYLAYELAAAGCRLVLSARRREELERVKERCVLSGPLSEDDVLVLPLDVTKFDTHAAATATVIDKFNRVDILVNNAGRSQRAKFDEISLDVDREMYELNVLGPLSLTRAVVPHMYDAKEGHVVLMSSLAGKVALPNSASYNATKHALHGAFETLRYEGHSRNIKVTFLCPGPVFSDIVYNAFTGTKGQTVKKILDPKDKRMSTQRCAFLCAAAITNRLDEAWISKKPALLAVYLYQYMPSYTRKFMSAFSHRVSNVREGK